MQKNRIHEVIPNDYPDGIMPNDKLTPLFRMVIRHEIEEVKAKRIPIVRYDNELHKVYLEHSDRRREREYV